MNTNMTQQIKKQITCADIVPGAQIEVSQYIVSISRFNAECVAIKSKRTGEIIKIGRGANIGKRLTTIRRRFKHCKSSAEQGAFFDWMTPSMVVEMIEILRSGK